MKPFQRLQKKLDEIQLLGSINAMLGWDQQTNLPRNGAPLRSEQSAYLTEKVHQKIVSAEFGDLIAQSKASELSLHERRSIEEMERLRMKKIQLPTELVNEMSKATSAAINAWAQAKNDNNFSAFAPHLDELLKLSREKAQAYNISDVLYDNLLDDYDPSVTSAQLSTLFSRLETKLSPLIAEYSGHRPAPELEAFSNTALNQINSKIIEALGFDLNSGRLDQSPHPFTMGISPSDVRLTTRNDQNNLLSTIGGTIHECGHGLYEQNLPADLRPLGLCAAPGAGIHESQSRFYENVIGRSLSFFQWLAPIINRIRSNGRALSPEDLYLAANPVLPSPIRIEADETTYNLHIIIRFQLEQALLNGDLSVQDAPMAWNDAYEKALGIRPKNHQEGILQDIHWSLGYFGYFPSYTLGNLYSASYKKHLKTVLPNIDSQNRNGDFSEALAWLRTNIHQKGSLRTQEEIVEQAVGEQDHVSNLIEHFHERQTLAQTLRERS